MAGSVRGSAERDRRLGFSARFTADDDTGVDVIVGADDFGDTGSEVFTDSGHAVQGGSAGVVGIVVDVSCSASDEVDSGEFSAGVVKLPVVVTVGVSSRGCHHLGGGGGSAVVDEEPGIASSDVGVPVGGTGVVV